jgi:release factor glutamine methyltransferase
MNTLKTLLSHTDASLDAERLLSFVLNKPISFLRAHGELEINAENEKKFIALLHERAQGKPFAYITGEQPFWNLSLLVTPDVLIPRPETELLIEKVLQLVDPPSCFALRRYKVLDLGTGSGAIALAIAKERPEWTVVAVDKSIAALDIAEKNASLNDISNITFLHSDWYEALNHQTFDIIVSNPPYIAHDDPAVEKQVMAHEPNEALFAEENGLRDLKFIIQNAPRYLNKNGSLFVEHGYQQGDAVRALFKQFNFQAIETFRDFSDHERVTMGFI